jgi:hypothetical protein
MTTTGMLRSIPTLLSMSWLLISAYFMGAGVEGEAAEKASNLPRA